MHTPTPKSIAAGRRIAGWFVAVALFVYFAPTVFAASRGRPWFGLFCWNLATGWTGFGWLAAWWRATE